MLEIRNCTKTRVDRKLLEKSAREIFQKERLKNPGVSVALVSEKRAQELNLKYRKKNYVPNVLSFSEKEFGLGELVLCPQKIRHDAKKYGILFKQELVRVFRHGLLHLLGYSHTQIEKP